MKLSPAQVMLLSYAYRYGYGKAKIMDRNELRTARSLVARGFARIEPDESLGTLHVIKENLPPSWKESK